ncbi:protein NASP homolog [Anastrepha ludens]|uniref:protein NASP homolog n=1 Tax=Anastrepha ludens TaxID=28586 RepID=UPI0023B0BC73|nr:protein NASP homolog [Anastrepha ludens]
MSTEEQIPVVATADVKAADSSEKPLAAIATDPLVEQERAEKILKAKELYSHGSRNFLVKSYVESADELSQVCALYEELYGEQSDELGMPYLLYAKSLIALALDENKVIDVPDEEELEDDDDEDDDEAEDDEAPAAVSANGAVATSSNGAVAKAKLDDIKEKVGEVDSANGEVAKPAEEEKALAAVEKNVEDAQVSSTDDVAGAGEENKEEKEKKDNAENGTTNGKSVKVVTVSENATSVAATPVLDGEMPSTSNGDAGAGEQDDEEENEAASNLQLAWEILELAAKIFTRQGTNGLPNLAEVQTELANIEFENNLPEAAREDYGRALKIYSELPSNYRRAMAEIHYKIGLTYLMQQLNKEGAESLKDACTLIDAEIKELQASEEELSDKQKNNIQDMEETKQEIWAKIAEIEDTQAQNVAEVRAALDSYIKPISSENKDGAGASTSMAAGSSSSSLAKPSDISHLIKRKKPDEHSSEAEATPSPAKRPAI